jgi:hypothetical protein
MFNNWTFRPIIGQTGVATTDAHGQEQQKTKPISHRCTRINTDGENKKLNPLAIDAWDALRWRNEKHIKGKKVKVSFAVFFIYFLNPMNPMHPW